MIDCLDLLHGDTETVAALLGVTRRTVQLYKAGRLKLPEGYCKLLAVLRGGDLGQVLGDAWAGFSFGLDGRLFVPGWANGMRPEQIRAMFFVFQEAAALRSDVRRLRAGHRAADLHVLRDLVALQVSNDCNGRDDAKGEVLGSSHLFSVS